MVDSQILNQLGDTATPRVPHDRFLMVQIAVTNSSNVDNPIPAIEMIGDNGKTYSEVTDGSEVVELVSTVRHVGAGALCAATWWHDARGPLPGHWFRC